MFPVLRMLAMRVSIVIRSKNEEHFIGSVLQRVLEQEFTEQYEVIVLDSGSKDRTVEIVRGFPVRLEEIPTGEFTFGFALNHGASLAHGEYVVFLSAHCVPCSRSWLRELVTPFTNNALVVATYGRQKPIPGVNPFEERELEQSYTLQADNTVRASFSNANSAVRKSVWQDVPFDEETSSGEDFLWAYTLPAPYIIRYVHDASVFHSHPPLLRYWRRRWYEEGLMGQYLALRHKVPDPQAASSPSQSSLAAMIGRSHKTIRELWQKREFVALCRYPLFALNRIYWYKKGHRDGEQLYGPSRNHPSPTKGTAL
jgi:rhamnosyltransferase